MIELETQHLKLRQWQTSDFEPYAAFFADSEAAKFVGGSCTADQAWRRMTSLIGHWVLRGYGLWAVEEKASGAFAGCIGIWFPEGWPEIELGYWLTPNMQGKGYAYEAGLEARRFAFDTLKVETLVSYIAPDNEASKRLAERLGAQYDTMIELLDHGPHCVYRYAKT